MSTHPSSEHSDRSRFVSGLAWAGIVVGIYLFSMGPVVRWFPDTAEIIYAPMSPVADWPMAGDLMRRWISVWGVDVEDEE